MRRFRRRLEFLDIIHRQIALPQVPLGRAGLNY